MSSLINYVIARLWDKDEPEELCIYFKSGEVHRGTLKEAKAMLAYVNRQEPNSNYKIYSVKFEELK